MRARLMAARSAEPAKEKAPMSGAGGASGRRSSGLGQSLLSWRDPPTPARPYALPARWRPLRALSFGLERRSQPIPCLRQANAVPAFHREPAQGFGFGGRRLGFVPAHAECLATLRIIRQRCGRRSVRSPRTLQNRRARSADFRYLIARTFARFEQAERLAAPHWRRIEYLPRELVAGNSYWCAIKESMAPKASSRHITTIVAQIWAAITKMSHDRAWAYIT